MQEVATIQTKDAAVNRISFWVVGQFEKWHGRLAREITRKMRVPPQTDPLLEIPVLDSLLEGQDHDA